MDTVNMSYHHGQLRDSLSDAALELARAGGPAAVGLRAVSRAAGVSHNAAYRHYADLDSLLGEACRRCMVELATLIETRMGEVPDSGDPVADAWLGLAACGRAYVEFAVSEPGWFRTAFAVPRSVGPFEVDKGAGPGGLKPYQLLGSCLDRLAGVDAVPLSRRPGAEYAAWCAVHGLATLLVDGPLRELAAAEREVALSRVLDTVVRGL